MNKKISYILLVLIMVIGFGIGANAMSEKGSIANKFTAVPTAPPTQTRPRTEQMTPQNSSSAQYSGANSQQSTNYVDPVHVVKYPSFYLNKHIDVLCKFDKFATLGLDYKPAYRSSESYISFLIMRTDTDKNIPLSEMKLFLKRAEAEKLVELKEGDKVKFRGLVFSNALGDVWVDVEKMEKAK